MTADVSNTPHVTKCNIFKMHFQKVLQMTIQKKRLGSNIVDVFFVNYVRC